MSAKIVEKRFTVDIKCDEDLPSYAIEQAIEKIRDYRINSVYVSED